MPGFPKWSLSLRISHQNPVCASALPHTRYIVLSYKVTNTYNSREMSSLRIYDSVVHDRVFLPHFGLNVTVVRVSAAQNCLNPAGVRHKMRKTKAKGRS